jgi:hypothetical protein
MKNSLFDDLSERDVLEQGAAQHSVFTEVNLKWRVLSPLKGFPEGQNFGRAKNFRRNDRREGGRALPQGVLFLCEGHPLRAILFSRRARSLGDAQASHRQPRQGGGDQRLHPRASVGAEAVPRRTLRRSPSHRSEVKAAADSFAA